MSHFFAEPDAALGWLADTVAAGEGGKVLLAGFQAGQARAAWAAGLSGPVDYPNFETFARFALRDCDGYWLMLPGVAVGTYQLELRDAEHAWQGATVWRDAAWELGQIAPQPGLGDLLERGPTLPGLMRRELTALAERVAITAPN